MDHTDRYSDHFFSKTYLIFLVLFLGLVGCATSTRQTDEILQSENLFPQETEILNVPFVAQTEAHCGPATLTMAMQWVGKLVTLDQVSPQVFTPGMNGSLQSDMVSAARRNGLMAIPIQGMRALLTEVASHHPVIVFENLSVRWLPQWHYALVYGYDLKKPEVVLHSGPEQGKRWDLRKFERSWMLGDYWGLVVLNPGDIAVSAGELPNLTAAAALEQAGFLPEAEKSYLRIEKQWPDSLAALIGLGNVSYATQKYDLAVKYLERAQKHHPESSIVKNNLATAKIALKAKSPNTRRK